jgi:hypothetical protein
MYEHKVPTAGAFREAFIAAYYKARACFTSESMWDSFCGGSATWSSLMLPRPQETWRLPREIGCSVLSDVAGRLGLCYPTCQPMTLDAVFAERADTADTKEWFPINVAIEHENVRTGFQSEIRKLFSMRCPLKVGITYVPSSKPRNGLEEIAGAVKSSFELMSRVVGEDAKAEYLFLVGVERRVSTWYALEFRASDGPHGNGFQQVERPALTPVTTGVA